MSYFEWSHSEAYGYDSYDLWVRQFYKARTKDERDEVLKNLLEQ